VFQDNIIKVRVALDPTLPHVLSIFKVTWAWFYPYVVFVGKHNKMMFDLRHGSNHFCATAPYQFKRILRGEFIRRFTSQLQQTQTDLYIYFGKHLDFDLGAR